MPRTKGAGDTIAAITRMTGIDKAVKAIAGDDCGCKERQAKLNERFPNLNQAMTKEQKQTYERLEPLYSKGRLPAPAGREIITLFNDLFNAKAKPTRCGTCIQQKWNDITKVYLNSCGRAKTSSIQS